jgi:hypothetical protein
LPAQGPHVLRHELLAWQQVTCQCTQHEAQHEAAGRAVNAPKGSIATCLLH